MSHNLPQIIPIPAQSNHRYKSKKKAFTKYAKKWSQAPGAIDAELQRIKVRLLVY
jgi:hypothetical protein